MRIRSEGKHNAGFTYSSLYDLFIKDKEEDSPYYIDRSKYIKICTLFFKKIMYNILHRAGQLYMPYNLGCIYVSKKKMKYNSKCTAAIDFYTSNKIGKVVKYDKTNNPFKYNFKWNKIGNKAINISKYRFKASRDNKRLLAKLINSKEYDYLEE